MLKPDQKKNVTIMPLPFPKNIFLYLVFFEILHQFLNQIEGNNGGDDGGERRQTQRERTDVCVSIRDNWSLFIVQHELQ